MIVWITNQPHARQNKTSTARTDLCGARGTREDMHWISQVEVTRPCSFKGYSIVQGISKGYISQQRRKITSMGSWLCSQWMPLLLGSRVRNWPKLMAACLRR